MEIFLILTLASLLIIYLLVFIKVRSINSRGISNQVSNRVEEEFNSYKKKSLVRDQKLRRQLQDEINKQRRI